MTNLPSMSWSTLLMRHWETVGVQDTHTMPIQHDSVLEVATGCTEGRGFRH